MLRHHLVTALRNARRFRSSTVVNVLGLALGLACFIGAYGFVTYMRSGDAGFANADRIVLISERLRFDHAVNFDTGYAERSSTPAAGHLRSNFPELEAVARVAALPALLIGNQDKAFFMPTAAVDPEFLEIFDLPFLTSTSDNPLRDSRSAILTAAAARKLFGTTDVLGRTLTLSRTLDVAVAAVIDPISQPSHIGRSIGAAYDFDIMVSRDAWLMTRGQPTGDPQPAGEWGDWAAITYALLPADGSLTLETFNERLATFAERVVPERGALQLSYRALPLSEIRLAALDRQLFRGGDVSIEWLLLLLGGLVLAIACVNYANLTLAQAAVRFRDVGLQRVLGASRRRLAAQHTVEAALQAGAAALLATLLLAATVKFAGVSGSASAGQIAGNPQFWTGVLALIASVVIAISLYPALALSRVRPAHAIRSCGSGGGVSSGTRWLAGAQFAVASVLLIGLFVVSAQNSRMRAAAAPDDGDPVVLLGRGWGAADIDLETLRAELSKNPAIEYVSAVGSSPWAKGGSVLQTSPLGAAAEIPTNLMTVYYDFDRALGMRLLAGRSFDRVHDDGVPRVDVKSFHERGEPYSAVIDRALAARFGWSNPDDAVGKIFDQPTVDGPVPVRVIGVIENRPLRLEHVNGMASTAFMYVLFPADSGPPVIRIAADQVEQALSAIDSTLKRMAPGVPVERRFLDEDFQQAYRTYALTGQILGTMTTVALIVAAMGLFAMALFIVSRRTHEIGVRKTLGARTLQVVSMLLRDFAKPVVLANVLVWPLAYLLVQHYLSMFVEPISLDLSPFLLSLAATLFIAWVAVGGHAMRAARVHPASVLRHE